MIISSKMNDKSHITDFPIKLAFVKKGKEKRGDIATTPAKGSFGFS
jgi:hypothetical protein